MAKDGSPTPSIRRALVALAVALATTLVPGVPAGAALTAPGQPCGSRPEGTRTLDPATGQTVVCQAGPGGRRWVAAPNGAQVLPTAPTSSGSAGTARRAPYDPLPATMGDPTGLPPGVSLPPGTVLRPGSPLKLPRLDWWKDATWYTAADVDGTDLDALHAHFVAQCSAIGWRHDPERVERLPDRPNANRSYDRTVQMVLGTCRTVAGSATDPTRRRPWYLAWSVALRPGATRAELVVELRHHTPHGGRFG